MKDPPTPPHSNVPYEKPAKIKHLGTHPTAYRQMTAVSRCFYRPTGKAPRPTTRGFSCPKIPCRKRHYHVHNRIRYDQDCCCQCFNAASGITMCTTFSFELGIHTEHPEFQCRKRHYHVHNGSLSPRPPQPGRVSMPQAALPCAQPRYAAVKASAVAEVSMPQAALPCAQLRFPQPLIFLGRERRFGKPRHFWEKCRTTFPASCSTFMERRGEKPHAASLGTSERKSENLPPFGTIIRFSSFRIIASSGSVCKSCELSKCGFQQVLNSCGSPVMSQVSTERHSHCRQGTRYSVSEFYALRKR